MRTSTRCDRGAPTWRTRFASGVKIFLTLFLLSSFLMPAKTFAQTIVIDGNANSVSGEWNQIGITHVADKYNLVNQDTIFGGSSKDFYYAGNTASSYWTWVLGTAKDKDDIANGAAALVSAVDTGALGNHVTAGAPFLVFAGDRISNSGDAQIGFWFFQDGTAPVTGGYFAPDKHAPPVRGDILVLADFTNGGRNAAVTVLEWVGTGGNYAGNAAFNLLNVTEAAVAENNSGTSPVPTGWSFKDKNNNDNNTNTTTYSTNEFYEGYVALGNLFGNVPVCFSRFMLETRSTHEITATLDDFVGGPLGGAPQPLSLTGSAACAGTTGTITSSTSVSGLSYQLYNSSNVAVQTAQTGTGSALTWSNIPIGNGYYVVTTNTSTQCTATSTPVNVTSVPNPTANAGPDQTLCQTAPSGPTVFTLAGTASNGTTAWSVVTSTGSASATITTPTSLTSTVSVAGTGTVTLRLTTTSNTTPACGTATDDIILTVNANPTANAGPDQAKCQTAPSGPTSFTLAGTASNGTTAWSQVAATGTASASITTPSSLTSTVSVSGIGTVTLRLTTTSGSCGTATDDVVLTVNANPTANAGPDQTSCQTGASGPTSFTLAGTASNGTTAWSVQGTTGSAAATIADPTSLTSTVSVSGTGTVTLRLTTTSGTGCGTATDDVVLTVVANATNNAGPDQTLCQTAPSGPTMFTLAGTAANGTSSWSQFASTGTASASITTPSSLTSTVSVSGIGTVTLRLTTVSDCGTVTDDVVLTVNANPTANAGPDQTKCQTAPSGPTSFTLAGTASNGTTAWTQVAQTGTANASITTPSSLTSTVSVSGIGTVTLRLTTTSGTGCGTATDDVVLTVNANPTANAGPDQTQCRTASGTNTFGTNTFTLAGTASNGTTAWSIAPGGNPQGYTVNIVTPTSLTSSVQISGSSVNGGTVTLRLTTTSASCGSATDDVVLTLNALPLIQTLTATNFCPNATTGGTVTLQNSQVGVSYQLQKDGTNYGSPQNGTGSAISWSPVPAGTYNVVGTVLATSCNTTSGPASVAENSVPDPTADNKDVCVGSTVTLTGSPSGGTWSGAHVTGSTFDATGVAAGDYTVTYSITNESGCTASVNATVHVHALPTPTADNKEVCEGATVDLTGSPSGGTWSGAHVTGSTFDATGVASGSYTVTYTVTDAFGCTGSTTATVTVKTCGGPLCTYTQGYYGNTNGNSCDADGSGSGSITYQNPIALITAELNNGGTLTVGSGDRSVYLPASTPAEAAATATKLNSVMPGNTTPRELSATAPGGISIMSGAFNSNYLNKQGRINNVLLSQTITLGLNMRISTGLPDLVLQAGTLVTVAPDGPCGTTTAQPHKCVYNTAYPYNLISDNYSYRTFSADIITALNNGHYPLTVTGLFHLASDALGNADGTVGSEQGASLSSINAAVDLINNAFDGCRILVGWNISPCAPYNPPPAITTQSRTTASELATDNKLNVSAYPNPYTDVIKFTIQSNVSGRAQLEVVNMLGQRIATVYNGYIQANKNQVVEYRVPSPAQQNLIYVLTIGDKKVTGKVLKANE